MKITKLAHSCLLVELPAPANRTILFDPGNFSEEMVRAADLKFLDDIVITHGHPDHFSLQLIQELVRRFPEVRILAPQEVVDQLREAGVEAGTKPSEGLALFDSPHEQLEPLGPTPQEIGVHYLDILSHPGDSHHFGESKAILALPVTAPWGATTTAAKLAAGLKPQYIIPIHDWLWKEEWKMQMYAGLAQYFSSQGIEFIQPVDGDPFVLNIELEGQAT